jgi:hypothetical protein
MVTLYGKEGKVKVKLPGGWKVVTTLFKNSQRSLGPLEES